LDTWALRAGSNRERRQKRLGSSRRRRHCGQQDHLTIIIRRRAKELTIAPYKFLGCYDIADSDIFYGRAAVFEQLAAPARVTG